MKTADQVGIECGESELEHSTIQALEHLLRESEEKLSHKNLTRMLIRNRATDTAFEQLQLAFENSFSILKIS